ncbi:replication protein A 70 kDa DNA-binding subunit C-like protein [Tanacetum coccineum]
MSEAGASSKKNMSGEVASLNKNKHKEAASSQEIIPMHGSSSASVLFLDELQVGVTGTIIVMLCRIWDVSAVTGHYLSTDLVVSDAQPNKEEYRIRNDDTFLLEFDGDTSVRKSLVKAVGFIRHPFELVDLESVEHTNDVARYITNVGRSIQQRTGSRTLDFYLANERVTLWGGLGDILIEKKTKYVGLCPFILTSVNAKHYNNRLYLSSSSSTKIFDDADIPTLKALRADDSGMQLTKEVMPVEYSETREGTLENLLMWARNRRNDSVAFISQVRIDHIRTKMGWNFPACGEEKYKKGVTRKLGGWWCEACNQSIEYPVLRYKLELGVSDATTQQTRLWRSKKREDLEDSDAELSHSPGEGVLDGTADDHSDRKKKKRVIMSDSE